MTSRKRSAEGAGHETDDADRLGVAGAVGADAEAQAESALAF